MKSNNGIDSKAMFRWQHSYITLLSINWCRTSHSILVIPGKTAASPANTVYHYHDTMSSLETIFKQPERISTNWVNREGCCYVQHERSQLTTELSMVITRSWCSVSCLIIINHSCINNVGKCMFFMYSFSSCGFCFQVFIIAWKWLHFLIELWKNHLLWISLFPNSIHTSKHPAQWVLIWGSNQNFCITVIPEEA